MTVTDDYDHVDLSNARETLRQAIRRLDQLDGTKIPPRQTGRARTAELASLTKQLLFVGHLCRRAEVEILDEYYVAKGETEHLEGGE